MHRAIASLRVGDTLRYIGDEWGIRLEDASGTTVGRLSKSFEPPSGLRCQETRVRAILVWRKSDSAAEYQANCRSEIWEVVLPELIFGQ
ncbi:MAG: hypothetical protein FWF12_11690 [Betaproteobacteria bacterium]|nr:hypothetical protein [Betaproteobacteria bacterium]